MNIKVVYSLAVLSILAMIGMIVLQFKWMKDSYNERQMEFDDSVYQALSDALTEYEKVSTLMFFNDNSELQNAYNIQSHEKENTTINEEVQLSYELKDTSSQFYKILSTELNIPKDVMVNMTDKDLLRLQSQYNKFNDRWKNQMKLMLFESICVDEKIFIDTLRTLIKDNLLKQNIALDFKTIIIDANTEGIIHSDYENIDLDILDECYKSKIFPNSAFNNYAVLFLNIPKKSKQIFDEMIISFLASSVFIGIIMLSFLLLVYIIYRQKRLTEMKTDFINNMTHELKTPVSTISLATNMIKNKKIQANKEKLEYYSNIIKKENERLLNNIEKVLQAARYKKSDIKLNLIELDVVETVTSIVERNRLRLENGTIRMKTNLDSYQLICDKTHFNNIINNLLENSVKYKKEEIALAIVVYVNKRDDGVEVSVEDNGIGIPADVQDRVFEKFYRVPTGNIHNVKGFGLGLNYVKEMVEAHGGTVGCESDLGEGSTFTVFFPNNNQIN